MPSQDKQSEQRGEQKEKEPKEDQQPAAAASSDKNNRGGGAATVSVGRAGLLVADDDRDTSVDQQLAVMAVLDPYNEQVRQGDQSQHFPKPGDSLPRTAENGQQQNGSGAAPTGGAADDAVAAAVGRTAVVAIAGDDSTVDEEVHYHYDLSSSYRWFIIVSFSLASLLAGPWFFNWPPFDDMFHWGGAYSKMCHPSDPTYEVRPSGEVFCNAQRLQIESMASMSVSVIYIFDFVAGILLDSLGAKVTTLFGLLMQAVGWAFIGLSSPTGMQGYKLGVGLIAGGCDPALFGMLSVGNLFPGWTATAIAALGTVRSVSFAVPLILRSLWAANRETVTLRGIGLSYALILLFIAVFSAMYVPWQPYPKLPPGIGIDTEAGPGKVSLSERMNRKPQVDLRKFRHAVRSQYKACKTYAFTLAYLALVFIAAAQLLRNSYYQITYKHHLPRSLALYELMSPLSLIPCPLFGMLADYYSAALTMASICFCAAISMLFATSQRRMGEIASIMFNWLFQAFISSQFYVYLAYNYPVRLYGKLAGFALLVGGMVGLLGSPLNSYVDRTGEYTKVDSLVVLAGAIATGLSVWLHYSVESPNREKERNAKAAQGNVTTSPAHQTTPLDTAAAAPRDLAI